MVWYRLGTVSKSATKSASRTHTDTKSTVLCPFLMWGFCALLHIYTTTHIMLDNINLNGTRYNLSISEPPNVRHPPDCRSFPFLASGEAVGVICGWEVNIYDASIYRCGALLGNHPCHVCAVVMVAFLVFVHDTKRAMYSKTTCFCVCSYVRSSTYIIYAKISWLPMFVQLTNEKL